MWLQFPLGLLPDLVCARRRRWVANLFPHLEKVVLLGRAYDAPGCRVAMLLPRWGEWLVGRAPVLSGLEHGSSLASQCLAADTSLHLWLFVAGCESIWHAGPLEAQQCPILVGEAKLAWAGTWWAGETTAVGSSSVCPNSVLNRVLQLRGRRCSRISSSSCSAHGHVSCRLWPYVFSKSSLLRSWHPIVTSGRGRGVILPGKSGGWATTWAFALPPLPLLLRCHSS